MDTPFQKVTRFIQRHAMFEGANGVLVAVSGGPDSVALLDMLARISAGDTNRGLGAREEHWGGGEDGLGRGKVDGPLGASDSSNPQHPTSLPLLHVAHLDHMLRGRESVEDAEFVRALADEMGLEITISSIDVRAAVLRTGRGIEETAREVRYEFLRAVADQAGCDRIAVGHTMTDQAETFLMRLARGAGLRGLAAMRPVVAAHTFREVRGEKAEGGGQQANNESLPSAFCLLPSTLPSVSIIRPLLCITRDEVEEYCRQRCLPFQTDETNLSLPFTRNRVRADVLPALKAINPRIVESISRTAEHIAADQVVLHDLASSLLLEARFELEGGPDARGGKIAAYSVSEFLKQRLGLRRRMIIEAIRLARAAVDCEVREADSEVTAVHVEAIDELLRRKESGKHIVLPGSLEVWLEYDTLVIKRSKTTEGYLAAISTEYPAVEAGGFAFRLERGLPAELLGSVIEGVRQERTITGRDWMSVGLDDCLLPDHLVIRPRLRGERVHVCGQRRTIKLKKLMIDHRIPSSRRATWPLVTSPDGSYIWSPGLPPSVEFAAHDKTQSLAIVRASAI